MRASRDFRLARFILVALLLSMKVQLAPLLALCLTGCFSERSFPMRASDVARVVPVDSAPRLAPRPWLTHTHHCLKGRLPWLQESALLTEDLIDQAGRPTDVFAHFHIQPAFLESVLFNFFGLSYTAQVTGADFSPRLPAFKWPDYQETWIPINDRLSLHGLLGYAKQDGKVIDADCIVILPGLLGHNTIHRTKDLADALRQSGLHVLPVELRGHGQTDSRYPEVSYTGGVLECDDLLAVSEWLQSQPHIRRTGLIGFCWGANEALVTAWYDGRAEKHPSISEGLAPHLRLVSGKRHYEAGVMAFSPILCVDDIMDTLRTPQSAAIHPVLASLQRTVVARMTLKNHSNPSGSLRSLIDAEFARSELSYPNAVEDALNASRLRPHQGRPDGDKLADCRVPVLIVHAANDPLSPAQDVADLFARVKNPNVAGLILPSGGHIGFAAYNRSYAYSLILNFFDPANGPVACPTPQSLQSSPPDAARPLVQRPDRIFGTGECGRLARAVLMAKGCGPEARTPRILDRDGPLGNPGMAK